MPACRAPVPGPTRGRQTACDPGRVDDAGVQDRTEELERILGRQPVVAALLERVPSLELSGWYLGAGCITQTVWNALHGFDPTFGIKDYDLVYFDPSDLTIEAEHDAERRANRIVADLAVTVDVTNEARVHLWYEERFGHPIAPYDSMEAAIVTWPTTASSIGVRRTGAALEVCAPFGLDDLLAMIVRPNKRLVSREVYEAKAARWTTTWPRLTVLPW
jgi:uncharacterized protein